MLSSNFSFLCRKSKCDRNGKAPVEMSVIINGSRTYVRLPMKCTPAEFSVLKSRRNTNWLKEYLNSVYADIQRVMSEMQVRGVKITADALKVAYLNGAVPETYTLGMLRCEYLEIVKGRTGYETYRRYELAFDLFLTICSRGTEVLSVSNADILRYKNIVEGRFDSATAYGYLSRLKSFFIFGVNNGRLSVSPFNGIKLRRVSKPVEIMTDEEYCRLRDSSCLGIERLERVRDLFIFACNSGLSFCDAVSLSVSDFSLVEGRVVIDKCRKKTGVRFYSVVLPDGVRILEKYGYCLPCLSNQKVNAYAKELGDICRIGVRLHFHLCRHYYISKLIRCGVSPSIVQRCAGHSRISQTMSYTHLVKEDIVRSISTAFG